MSERYKFYNPYNFIPLRAPNYSKERKDSYTYSNIRKGDSHVRHDRWQVGTKSGRIICSLTLETPTFVGAERTEGDKKKKTPATATHYRNHEGLAIPANSLRGMITPIAEALSSSAFRVLANEDYSVRASMNDALSAVGIVSKEADNWYIKPLTLPMLSAKGFAYKRDLWNEALDNPRLSHYLPVLVGDIKFQSNNKENNEIIRKHNSFHEKHNAKERFFVKLDEGVGFYEGVPKFFEEFNNMRGVRFPRSNRSVVLGQCSKGSMECGDGFERDESYMPGVLFILESPSESISFPDNKRHSKFIPMPEEKLKKIEEIKIPIPQEVLLQYKKVAEKRALQEGKESGKYFPVLPKGYFHPKESTSEKPVRYIQEGDLVYFDIHKIDGDIKVSKLSYSSIWRNGIDGSTYDFVEKVSGDLLPWNNTRKSLTAAEALFGVVSESTGKSGGNLASRVLFSDAVGENISEVEDELLLPALSSPKAPSPSMYFKNTNNTYIKSVISKKNDVYIRGRKYYLPHSCQVVKNNYKHSDEITKSSYDDDKVHLRLRCSPLETGQILYFHIDFNNLDDSELALLLASIKPGDGFVHRVGAGKSIGLGCVKVSPEVVCFYDRENRYQSLGIDLPRYKGKLQRRGGELPKVLKEKYEDELSSEFLADVGVLESELIDVESLMVIQQLGDLRYQGKGFPVSYPYSVASGQTSEGKEEGFKWYVRNNDKNNQGQVLPEVITKFEPDACPSVDLLGGVCEDFVGFEMKPMDADQVYNVYSFEGFFGRDNKFSKESVREMFLRALRAIHFDFKVNCRVIKSKGGKGYRCEVALFGKKKDTLGFDAIAKRGCMLKGVEFKVKS